MPEFSLLSVSFMQIILDGGGSAVTPINGTVVQKRKNNGVLLHSNILVHEKFFEGISSSLFLVIICIPLVFPHMIAMLASRTCIFIRLFVWIFAVDFLRLFFRKYTWDKINIRITSKGGVTNPTPIYEKYCTDVWQFFQKCVVLHKYLCYYFRIPFITRVYEPSSHIFCFLCFSFIFTGVINLSLNDHIYDCVCPIIRICFRIWSEFVFLIAIVQVFEVFPELPVWG